MEKSKGKNGKALPDDVLVECYLRHLSQNLAAAELGVSRETVARAVRRAGIALTGRKKNGKTAAHERTLKITDEELKDAAKTLTGVEIAQKYGMHVERVRSRAKQLGVFVDCTGIGGHWRERAERYGCRDYDNDISLKRLYERDGGVCQICGLPTDPYDIKGRRVGKNYPTLDHITPLSKGGSHTWDNVQLAHLACNSAKCDREE